MERSVWFVLNRDDEHDANHVRRVRVDASCRCCCRCYCYLRRIGIAAGPLVDGLRVLVLWPQKPGTVSSLFGVYGLCN